MEFLLLAPRPELPKLWSTSSQIMPMLNFGSKCWVRVTIQSQNGWAIPRIHTSRVLCLTQPRPRPILWISDLEVACLGQTPWEMDQAGRIVTLTMAIVEELRSSSWRIDSTSQTNRYCIYCIYITFPIQKPCSQDYDCMNRIFHLEE